MNRAADDGLAETVGLTNMDAGAILAPASLTPGKFMWIMNGAEAHS